ncbi:hypothetical protein CBL_05437 [Carabus blaptoides fortunei]
MGFSDKNWKRVRTSRTNECERDGMTGERVYAGERLESGHASISLTGQYQNWVNSRRPTKHQSRVKVEPLPTRYAPPGLRSLVITYPMNANCYIVTCPPASHWHRDAFGK